MLMTKRILLIFSFLVTITCAPVFATVADMESMAVEQVDDEQSVSIVVDHQSIRVSGAQGQVLEVISVTGRRVMAVRIDSPVQRVELTNIPKGCYIIKVGKVARKIVV